MPMPQPLTTSELEVVAVPFRYVERPVVKRRPAVVVSTSALHETTDLVWVLMITSAENDGWAGDIPVQDLERAGLRTASVIRPSKIATIGAGDLKPIGHLDAATSNAVHEALRLTLGL